VNKTWCAAKRGFTFLKDKWLQHGWPWLKGLFNK
jgi:hypothetical protein